jgi:hypothetical protein
MERDRRPPPPLSGDVLEEDERKGYSMGGRGTGMEWSEWAWEGPRWRFPILGALLIVVGAALLLEQLFPGLTLTTLVLLGAGIGLTAAFVARNVVSATVPGLVLLGWALARLGSELGYLPGDGWVATFIGIALLLAWVAGRTQRVAREWALWLGLALAAFGIADVTNLLPEIFSVEVIVPAAVIGLGIWLIVRGRRS